MRITIGLAALGMLVLVVGCEPGSPSSSSTSPMANTAPPPPSPAAPGEPGSGSRAAASDPATASEEPMPAETAAPPAEGEQGTSEVAGVGASGKGQDYGGPGFITTPIETMFAVEDRIVFDVHIPKNMELYKAEHDNKGPKSHEEFMRVIIKEGGVNLPELPEGEYWYDPATEQLMIRHAKEQ